MTIEIYTNADRLGITVDMGHNDNTTEIETMQGTRGMQYVIKEGKCVFGECASGKECHASCLDNVNGFCCYLEAGDYSDDFGDYLDDYDDYDDMSLAMGVC